MRWLPLAAAFVASLLLLPGCGGSKATVEITSQAPVIRSITVSPEDLRFTYAGGSVTLRVTADSDLGIGSVTAERSLLDSSTPGTRLFALTPAAGGVYQTTIQVPSNTSASGQPARYRLSVYAQDTAGATSDRIEYEIRVAAPDSGGLPGTPAF